MTIVAEVIIGCSLAIPFILLARVYLQLNRELRDCKQRLRELMQMEHRALFAERKLTALQPVYTADHAGYGELICRQLEGGK